MGKNLNEDGIPRPNDASHRKVPDGFRDVLDFVFAAKPSLTLLGGSYALSGFYLGHRVPQDIDLFFLNERERRKIENLLVRHYRGVAAEVDRGRRLALPTDCGEISVHLLRLQPRWIPIEIWERYSLTYTGICLATMPYLAMQKLIALGDAPKRSLALFDLLCIWKAGVSVDCLTDVVSELSPGVDFVESTSMLPRVAEVDGKTIDLAADANVFLDELKTVWRQKGLGPTDW
jgi:hypothetical protein